jgi:hypothetical protein
LSELKLRPPEEKKKPERTQEPTFPVKNTGTHRARKVGHYMGKRSLGGHLKVAAT